MNNITEDYWKTNSELKIVSGGREVEYWKVNIRVIEMHFPIFQWSNKKTRLIPPLNSKLFPAHHTMNLAIHIRNNLQFHVMKI